MKKKSRLLAAFLLTSALLSPMRIFAEQPKIEPFLERLSAEKIETTQNSIRITDKDLSKSGVAKVTFADEELSMRVHYTVSQDGDAVVVKWNPHFLSRQPHGDYSVRIEFVEHSADTEFHVDQSNSDVALNPPTAVWTPGA